MPRHSRAPTRLRDPGVCRILPHMRASLPAGEFFGTRSHDLVTDGFRMLESSYPAHADLPCHAHERAHFCLVLRGGFTERIGSRSWERLPASLCWYPAAAEHAECHASSGRHFLVEIDPAISARQREDEPGADEPLLLDRGGLAPWLALRLWLAARRGDDAAACETLAWELLAATARGRIRQRRGGAPWLSRIDDVLRARFARPPRVPELAELAGVHPVHLARCYRAQRGESIADTVRRHRVREAMDRLERRDTRLAQVAVEVGFADQSHMTRAFRELLHTTPRRFRKLVSGG